MFASGSHELSHLMPRKSIPRFPSVLPIPAFSCVSIEEHDYQWTSRTCITLSMRRNLRSMSMRLCIAAIPETICDVRIQSRIDWCTQWQHASVEHAVQAVEAAKTPFGA